MKHVLNKSCWPVVYISPPFSLSMCPGCRGPVLSTNCNLKEGRCHNFWDNHRLTTHNSQLQMAANHRNKLHVAANQKDQSQGIKC